MTQEEKARRYDEAIEKFDVILNLNTVKESGTIFADDVRKIFPELKESDDDRIRKGIIRNLEYLMDRAEGFVKDELKERIAWLEKQGEQKSACEVKPKFNVGDIIKPKCYNETHSIKAIGERYYILDVDIKIPFRDEDDWELVGQNSVWSEEDEKFVHGLMRGLSAKRDIHGHTTFSSDGIDITKTIDWLEHLKDRYTWKPSDEQMDKK